MKVTAATGRTGKVIFYDITTDAGTFIGSAITNDTPLYDDKVVTIEDAKNNATLWAAAPDMLMIIEEAEAWLSFNTQPSLQEISMFRNSLKKIIDKAKGL